MTLFIFYSYISYKNDEQLLAIVTLYEAFNEMNFTKLYDIWNNQIVKKETDPFIMTYKEEIFHNIRINFICSKIKAYKVCKFTSLEKVT